MRSAFEVLFVLTLFGPPLAIVTGLVVLALGVMTGRDRTKPASVASARETPRAA